MPASQCRHEGALAVIYDTDANEVITVLWAQGESRAGGPVRRTA